MKKQIGLFLVAILLMTLWGCKKPEDPQSELEQAMELYEEFLSGKRNAKWEGEDFSIDKIPKVGAGWDKYAFFDMNGDGIPELHIRFSGYYYIFSCKNGEIFVFTILPLESKLLNNGAILKAWDSESHWMKQYAYVVLDCFGNEQLNIDFATHKLSDDDETVYLYKDKEVSKEEWNTLTEKYFSIGSDQIEWIDVVPQ